MEQEYLFLKEKPSDSIKEYAEDRATCEIKELKDSRGWIVTYSVDGEKKENAIDLSTIDDKIKKEYKENAITLISGSSTYFNKMLYPHVNEFERKLRKLLYLKIAMNDDKRSEEVIKNVEKQDLGRLFEALFVDTEFVDIIKKKVNSGSKFTKERIIKLIEEEQENKYWDKIVGKESVENLRKNPDRVREYRNDVMHAHNIDYKTYSSAKDLFETINSEMDKAISECEGGTSQGQFDNVVKMLELASESMENAMKVINVDNLIRIGEAISKIGICANANLRITKDGKEIEDDISDAVKNSVDMGLKWQETN